MRGWLLAALLPALALGCGSAEPPLHSEVLVVATSDGGHVVARTDGSVLGRLPPGLLPVTVSAGDDIAEAYLVAAAGGETAISSVQPARGYQATQLASQPGDPRGAALVPAPQLISYVGLKTVLVVLSEGHLAGYQHGTLLWSFPVSGEPAELRAVGASAYLSAGGECRLVAPETGALVSTPLSIACRQPRPVALGALLAFPDGELWRVSSTGAALLRTVPAWASAPALSADGATVFVATTSGVVGVALSSGSRRTVTTAVGPNAAIGVSRDGNFLYALAEGELRTFRLADGKQVARVALDGDAIERVVGG